MVPQLLNSTAQEQRVNDVIAAYLKAVQAGEKPDRLEWLAQHPEVAGELASFFADQDQFDRLAEPLRAVLPGPADTVTIPFRQFGDYELLEEIGRGGMGVVYRARQIKLNRTVALKMIRAGELASATEVQRFQAEAEAAAHLDHPHIVPIYEVGEHQGQHYFSMKLIEGGCLAQWIADLRLQNADWQKQAARLLASVARAVHYAHQRGVIHRDLKPANILLQVPSPSSPSALCDLQSAIPMVSDFGLAKRMATLSPGELPTQSGAIVGTPSYMAPEQASGGKGLSCSVDIFSLGTMLYEMLTGLPPFKGETPLDTLIQVRECEPACPRTRNAHVDPDLQTICLKCLEKDPQKRYGSAEALAEDLERWLTGEPIQARPTGRAERLWRWGRRNPVVAALSAVVLLVTLGGFSGVLWQWKVALANEQKADLKAVQALEKEQEAKQQRNEARQQRDLAQRQREEVRALNEKLQTAQAKLRNTLYAAHMNLARHAWEEDDISRVQELLDQHRPKAGEPDLRGFEWDYLNHLCHSELLTLKGHTGKVRGLAYSPDGKRLASASTTWNATKKTYVAGEVKIWDAQTGREILTIQGHADTLVFSPDSKRLIGGGWNAKVTIWDAQSGQELLSHKGDLDGVAAFISPDGERWASRADSPGNEIKLWDVQTDKELLSLKGHTNWVEGVAFSPDGKRLATASMDGMVKVWDAQTGQELLSLKGTLWQIAFSPDGKRLAGGSWNTLKVWDAQTGQELLSRNENDGAYVKAFSPDGKHLATTSQVGILRIWDLQTGQAIRTFKTSGGVRGDGQMVAFSPDGQRLAGIAAWHTVKVWDAQHDQESRTLPASGEFRFVVGFSPD
jgi:WD40 repeat protein/serine/threonine protein kinase